MADVTLTYKGATIAELNDSGSKTLRTAGKFCEADIGVEYVKPSGGSGVDRGSFTPAEKSNTARLQVSREITGLMILAETNPYANNGYRTSAGLMYDTYGGVQANAMLGSNTSGNSGFVSMNANAFTITQNGNTVTVVSATGSGNGYFAAGITYRWVAW